MQGVDKYIGLFLRAWLGHLTRSVLVIALASFNSTRGNIQFRNVGIEVESFCLQPTKVTAKIECFSTERITQNDGNMLKATFIDRNNTNYLCGELK